MEISQTLEIRVPVPAVYQFWADYRQFPTFLENVQSIQSLGEHRSDWVIKGPMDARIHFVSEITASEPEKFITWQCNEGDLPHEGRVEFTPLADGQHTQLRLWLNLHPPGGQLGEKILRLGEMLQRDYVGENLHKLKKAIEAQSGSPSQPASEKSPAR